MWISIDPTKCINTTTRLQKHNNILSYDNLTNVSQSQSSSISFVAVIFIIMPKARRSSYTMAFKIKVIAEAEAVENNSEIAREYGLSESMVRRWRRDQATILSGELKMSAKRATMGRFTPKYPELDEQVMEWFSQQRDQGKYLFVMWNEKSFAELSEIVFQCVGSKESDWSSEIRCCHDNFKTCHVKSAGVTEFTVISIYFSQVLPWADCCFALKPKNSQMILPSKLPVGGTRNGNDVTRSACERKQHWHSDYPPTSKKTLLL